MVVNYNNTCSRIIEYLNSRNDKADDLDGILLTIFQEDWRKYQKELLQSLGQLISTNIVEEVITQKGDRLYRLIQKDTSDGLNGN